MKTTFARRLCLGLVATLICVAGINALTSNTLAQKTPTNENKQVKILSPGVELIELIPSAPKCPSKQKGETVRLKVTSESPIDVRLYVQTGHNQWLDKNFANQKRGDEITDYRCDPKPNFKVYAHTAGSNEAWPKP